MKLNKLVPCSAQDCPKVFDTVQQALRHIRDMHGQVEITRFRITNGPHWFIKCKECQYGFTAQKAYDTVSTVLGLFISAINVVESSTIHTINFGQSV